MATTRVPPFARIHVEIHSKLEPGPGGAGSPVVKDSDWLTTPRKLRLPWLPAPPM